MSLAFFQTTGLLTNLSVGRQSTVNKKIQLSNQPAPSFERTSYERLPNLRLGVFGDFNCLIGRLGVINERSKRMKYRAK
jgi:hypothetical protein